VPRRREIQSHRDRRATDNVTCEKCGTLMDSRANQSFLAYARMPGDE
jgi:hypothetical protein